MKVLKASLAIGVIVVLIGLAAPSSRAQTTCCDVKLNHFSCASQGCRGGFYYYSCTETENGVWAGGPNNVGCCNTTTPVYYPSNEVCSPVAPVARVREARGKEQERYVYLRTCSGRYVILRAQIEGYLQTLRAGS